MKFVIFIFFIFSSGIAKAHPTSYKGAVSVMTWNQPWLSDYWLTYSFRYDMAVAARFMQMTMPEGRIRAYLPQYDVLLKRWNGSDYQANVYAYGSFGRAEFEEKKGNIRLGGTEIDAESRKWFVLAKGEWMKTSFDSYSNQFEARLGLAPYEAQFTELASWFMVKYQFHPTLMKKEAITPMARFFFRNVLWETGVSLDGDYMLNLMFHF